LPAGYIKTPIYKSEAFVPQATDSPYSPYTKVGVRAASAGRGLGALLRKVWCVCPLCCCPQATAILQQSDIDNGIAKDKALDVNVFARRCVKALLRRRPPMNYLDGYTWRVQYYLGCFAPVWLQMIFHRVRLGFFSFL
jgi:hypothetical protein